jgi:hypothetical protein
MPSKRCQQLLRNLRGVGPGVDIQKADSTGQHSPSAVLNGSSEFFFFFWGIAVSLYINGSPFKHKIHQKEPLTVPKTGAMTFPVEWVVLKVLVAGEYE